MNPDHAISNPVCKIEFRYTMVRNKSSNRIEQVAICVPYLRTRFEFSNLGTPWCEIRAQIESNRVQFAYAISASSSNFRI